jgi:ABC-type lipoprotein release transport system permease subunit
MVSLVQGVQQQVKLQFEKIGMDRVKVQPEGEGGFGGGFNPFDLGGRVNIITSADVKRWEAWPQVVKVIPEIEIPSSIISGLKWRDKTVPVRVGSDSTPRRGPFSEGPTALFGTLDLPSGRGNIVVSRGTLRTLKIPEKQFASLLGQSVQVVLAAPRGQKQSYSLKISGISSEGSRRVEVSTPDRLAMKAWWFNDAKLLEKEGYDSVILRAADVTQAKALVARLRKEKLSVQSIDALLDVANRIFTAITAMLGLMSSVALFVAFIGIANTMIMSIYERTREIGTLKAMGASRGDIRQMFMLEAGLIGLFGGVAGVLLSWILGQGLDRFAHYMAQKRDIPLPEHLFLITPALASQALLFAFLIGIIAGLYPAARAARLDPLVALRHE